MSIPPYPRATYRLQLSRETDFSAAANLVPYLADLGISHVYTSPILAARSGSTHGYDIVDHNRLNPEYGGEEGFQRLTETLQRHGIGLIVDFVPNHMGVGFSDNAWWLNVLEWGESSPYDHFFDIDWKPSEQSLRGKVLIPILGSQYGDVLERRELSLQFDPEKGTFSIHYYEHRFPISPPHYSRILSQASSQLQEYAREFATLTGRTRSAQKMALRIRRARELSSTLAELVRTNNAVAETLEKTCSNWDGNRLHQLLERQSYRLAYWRMAANEINYRRFFDINDLAAVRMERPEVFEITHQLILRLIQEGSIQGLRLDHVDGLLDPRAYLSRLQEAVAYRLIGSPRQPERSLHGALRHPIYVVVEKILAHHEELRPSWEVSGTTGYEHMTLMGEVLTDPAGEEPLTETYETFLGIPRDFPSTVLKAKYRTMQQTLASELNVLANRLSRLAKSSRWTRDLSRLALRNALMDIVARFPVYRSYVDASGVSDQDRRDIEWAVASARKASEEADTSAYDFIQEVLTLDLPRRYPRAFRRREVLDLAMKVQQFTAPVMAKSFEDTAFYRDARFIARNEVGGEPDRFYASVQAFHYANRDRLQKHPFSMVATATHDHKRGEDTRSRLAVISERPSEWAHWVTRIATMTGGVGRDASLPTARDQYLLLQTIVGTWPLEMTAPDYPGHGDFTRRVLEYAVKAAREAKLETRWTAPDEEYEGALERYLHLLLDPQRSPTIMRHIDEFVRSITMPGLVNSLVQKALTLTVPGVPDMYQGTTNWDFSLVDPDNRRPVDFSAEATVLRDLEQTPRGCTAALSNWKTGAPKSLVAAALLRLRATEADLFAVGDYLPLETVGIHRDRIIAFARVHQDRGLIVVVPRLAAPLMDGAAVPLVPPTAWEDTGVDLTPLDGTGVAGVAGFTDIFTGRALTIPKGRAFLSVATVLEFFPCGALLS